MKNLHQDSCTCNPDSSHRQVTGVTNWLFVVTSFLQWLAGSLLPTCWGRLKLYDFFLFTIETKTSKIHNCNWQWCYYRHIYWEPTTVVYSYQCVYGVHTVEQWLRHCATSQKVAGSIPDGLIGIFHWYNPSNLSVALGLVQSLTEMSTRNNSWGVKAAGE